MKEYLKGLPWFLAAVAVLIAIGYLIERWRRRELQSWAAAQGGTFEGGGILDEVAIPEAASFGTSAGSDRITYNNVTRIVRPEATYVLAQYYHQYLDTRNNRKSNSCVVCFVTLPSGDWPSVSVHRPVFDLLGRPKPSPLAVPGAVPGFSAFEIQPREEGTTPGPDALARLLPPAVQNELVANPDLISGLSSDGRIVRVAAVGQRTGYPHAKVFEVARRMAAAWSGGKPPAR